jgi:hypothetical protein
MNPYRSPDTLYVNVGVINASSGDTLGSVPVPASFVESRLVPIIDDAANWDFSIVRFNLDGVGALLPLWIPQIAIGTANPTLDPMLTVYQVQIGFGPSAIPATSCVFETCFPTLPRPASPILAQDVSNLQYFAKSYLQFTHMVNNALESNWIDGGAPIDSPPKLRYNPVTKLFSFELNSQFVSHEPTVWLSVNAPLAALLTGFDWRYNQAADPTVNNPALLPHFFTLNVEEFDNPGPAETITQDFQSTNNGLWAAIDGFAFTTNLIPVVAEQGTATIAQGTSNVGNQGASVGVGSTTQLTDFNVTGDPEGALGSIEYVPSAEYRMGNLAGNGPVQQLDVQIFWRYRLTGALNILYLPSNSSAALKLMFRRKRW